MKGFLILPIGFFLSLIVSQIEGRIISAKITEASNNRGTETKSIKEMTIDSIERYSAAVREHKRTMHIKEDNFLSSKENENNRAIDVEDDDYLQYLILTLIIGSLVRQLFMSKNREGTVVITRSKIRQDARFLKILPTTSFPHSSLIKEMKKSDVCFTANELSGVRKLNALQENIEQNQDERGRQGDLWKLLMSEVPLLLSNEEEDQLLHNQ